MRQSACLAITTLIIYKFDSLYLYDAESGVRLYDGPELNLFLEKLVDWGRVFFLSIAWPIGDQLEVLFYSRFPLALVDTQNDLCCIYSVVSVDSSSSIHRGNFRVLDDALTS